jgi:hypothetical protein
MLAYSALLSGAGLMMVTLRAALETYCVVVCAMTVILFLVARPIDRPLASWTDDRLVDG